LRLLARDATALTKILTDAAGARWELDALEAAPSEGAVFARLAGPAEALDKVAAEILARWPGTTLAPERAQQLWRDVGELGWAHRGGTWLKLALTPAALGQWGELMQAMPDARGWVGAGGNVGWVSLPPGKSKAVSWPWPALTLSGAGPLWPGTQPDFKIFRAVKVALDARGRFPELNE
jgi:hypothetical protein